ncbi:hypothetical protein SpCBS45565_g05694 [Spizellomyces sp. 'palustris']|nr:hypothetical protein SpCBS45565_g05694 [Spizellomyces sp. 'palustris']
MPESSEPIPPQRIDTPVSATASSTTDSPSTDDINGVLPAQYVDDSPASSPTLSATSDTTLMQALDFDLLDFDDDLSSFDLVGSDWIRVLSSTFSAQRDRLEQTPFGRKFRKLVDTQKRIVNNQLRLLQMQQNPEAVKKRDKLAFVVGVTNMWVTALLVGVWPEVIPWFYVVKTFVLLMMRLVVYRRKRWHYFMFDMCYFVNALLILYLAFPGSHANLFAATWGLANGPVLIAITAWRNSLVFHSLDKVTSLLIHFDPPLTLFICRWVVKPHHQHALRILPDHLLSLSTNPPDISFSQMMLTSLATYVFWQAAYWVFVWTMRADKIKAGYATSTTWMLANQQSLIYRAAKRFRPAYQPAVFMAIQLAYTLITIAPTYLFYRFKWLNAAALMGSLCVATYNGANYYFEVFSRRYVEELKGLKKELERVGSSVQLDGLNGLDEGNHQSDGVEKVKKG